MEIEKIVYHLALRSIFFPLSEISVTSKRDLPIKLSHIFGISPNEAQMVYGELQQLKARNFLDEIAYRYLTIDEDKFYLKEYFENAQQAEKWKTNQVKKFEHQVRLRAFHLDKFVAVFNINITELKDIEEESYVIHILIGSNRIKSKPIKIKKNKVKTLTISHGITLDRPYPIATILIYPKGEEKTHRAILEIQVKDLEDEETHKGWYKMDSANSGQKVVQINLELKYNCIHSEYIKMMYPNSSVKVNPPKLEYDSYEVFNKLVAKLVKNSFYELEGKNGSFAPKFKESRRLSIFVEDRPLVNPNNTNTPKTTDTNTLNNGISDVKFSESFSLDFLPKMSGICLGEDSLLSADLDWLLSEVAQSLCIPKNYTFLSLLQEICKYLDKPKKIIVRNIEGILNNLGGTNWSVGLVFQEKEWFLKINNTLVSSLLKWLQDHDKLFKLDSKSLLKRICLLVKMLKDSKSVRGSLEISFEKIYNQLNNTTIPSSKNNSNSLPEINNKNELKTITIQSEKDKQMLDMLISSLKSKGKNIQESAQHLSSNFCGCLSKSDFGITYTEIFLYKMYSLYSDDLFNFSQTYQFDPNEFPAVFQLYQQISFMNKEFLKMSNFEDNMDLKVVEKELRSYLDVGKIFYPFIVEYLRRSEGRVNQLINNVTNKDTLTDFISENQKHSTSVECFFDSIMNIWKQLKELKLSDAFHYLNFGEVYSKGISTYSKLMQQKIAKTIEIPTKRKNKNKEIDSNLGHAKNVSKELCISINNLSFCIKSCKDLEKEVKEAMKCSENNNPIIEESWDQTFLPSLKFSHQVLDEYLSYLVTSTRELLPLFISADLQRDYQMSHKTKDSIVVNNEIFKNVNLKDEEQLSSNNLSSNDKQDYETLTETRTYFDERLSLISKYLSQTSFEKYLETVWVSFVNALEEQVTLFDITNEFMNVVEDDFNSMKDYMKLDENGWGLTEEFMNNNSSKIEKFFELMKKKPYDENSSENLISEYERSTTKSNIKIFIFKLLKHHEKDHPQIAKFVKENQNKYQEKSTNQLQMLNPFSRLMGGQLSSETVKQLEKNFNLRRAETILSYFTCIGGTLFVTTLNICFEPIVGTDFLALSFMRIKSVSKVRVILPGIRIEFQKSTDPNQINNNNNQNDMGENNGDENPYQQYFGFLNTDNVYNTIKQQAIKLGLGSIMK